MLLFDNVDVHYGLAHVLHGVSLQVKQGQIVCLLGRNGAGKTTTLKCVMGIAPASRGEVTFEGVRLNGLRPHKIARRGIAYVPEDRRVFGSLTVEENIRAASQALRHVDSSAVDRAFELFPDLRERHKQVASSLSGGQQQMLALARGLVAEPRLLLIDEPTEGLAPALVQAIRESILTASEQQGLTVLLVEQNFDLAMSLGDYFFVLSRGVCVFHGTQQALVSREDIIVEHLGVGRVAEQSGRKA